MYHLHNLFPKVLITRLKFFLVQLEENFQLTKEFLMKEFRDMYEEPVIISKTPIKKNFKENVVTKWMLPFGAETNGLKNLNNNDLQLEFIRIRKKLKEHKKIFCLYSRCLNNSRQINNFSDVS